MELTTKEVRVLADFLALPAETSGDPTDYLRDLTANRAALPDDWRRAVAGRRADNVGSAARWLVRWAAAKGLNPADPRYTTLGSLLEPVLTDVGPDVAAGAVAVIYRRRLYAAEDIHHDLVARYAVPDLPETAPPWLSGELDPSESIALQSADRRTPLLLDVDSLAVGIRRAAAVCRLEAGPDSPLGTAFVVGRDAVVTAGHVVDAAGERPMRIRTRSVTSARGEVHVVSRDRVRRFPGLDLAVLHTTEHLPSDVPHLRLDAASAPSAGDALAVLQHPGGGPMRLALTASGVLSVSPAAHSIRYVTHTQGGSSGAPCFNEAWEVVAVHVGERSTFFGSSREGVLTGQISWGAL